jgi:hypothetical protein
LMKGMKVVIYTWDKFPLGSFVSSITWTLLDASLHCLSKRRYQTEDTRTTLQTHTVLTSLVSSEVAVLENSRISGGVCDIVPQDLR